MPTVGLDADDDQGWSPLDRRLAAPSPSGLTINGPRPPPPSAAGDRFLRTASRVGSLIYVGDQGETHRHVLERLAPHVPLDDSGVPQDKKLDYETGYLNHKGHFVGHWDAGGYARDNDLLNAFGKPFGDKLVISEGLKARRFPDQPPIMTQRRPSTARAAPQFGGD